MKIKKLNGKLLRVMKIIHIICSQIWFGSVCCIFAYALYCFNNSFDKNTAISLIEAIPHLYLKVIMPFSVICVIQGIIYGIFTPFGFFKHKWLIAKWILFAVVIFCTGRGGMGELFTIIDQLNQNEITTLTMNDGKTFFLFIIGQILFLSIMTILSIIKPKNKKVNE
jgi:hypothetical protein